MREGKEVREEGTGNPLNPLKALNTPCALRRGCPQLWAACGNLPAACGSLPAACPLPAGSLPAGCCYLRGLV